MREWGQQGQTGHVNSSKCRGISSISINSRVSKMPKKVEWGTIAPNVSLLMDYKYEISLSAKYYDFLFYKHLMSSFPTLTAYINMNCKRRRENNRRKVLPVIWI